MKINPSTTVVRGLMAAAGLLAAAGGASAQTSPYYLGLSQAVSRDSYMQRYGGAGADWISSTGIRAGVDQTLGRQQLLASLSANANRYHRNDFLDNDDYALNGKLNWATVERLSGTLSVDSSQRLYTNNLSSLQQTIGRNMIRSSGVGLQAQLGVVTVWTLDAGISANRQRNSNAAYNYRDLEQSSLSAGVRWTPSPDLMVRLGARHTNGKLPKFNAGLGDEFDRNDIDLSTVVALTGVSSVNARLSSTRESHTSVFARNLRGWTGAAGWNWKPTGKLSFNLALQRDSSLGSADFVLIPTDARVSNTLSLTTNWEVTSKILFEGRVGYVRRTLDNSYSTSLLTPASGKDSISSLSLGLRYLPLRNLEFGCGISVDDHRVDSGSTAILAPAYNARVLSCYGHAYLR